ncbi:hypothetical protein K1719_017237 [Acacia pycnantha]|nr:hypothetical protein K1719_017237 [Acacia pycnantha]
MQFMNTYNIVWGIQFPSHVAPALSHTLYPKLPVLGGRKAGTIVWGNLNCLSVVNIFRRVTFNYVGIHTILEFDSVR